MMFPFCAFGLVAVPLLLTLRPKTETMAAKLARVDWLGGALFISSATSFLMAISWGGTQFAWASAQTLAPLVAGSAGLLATCLWERHGAGEPFLKHSLFGSASAVATYVCGAVQGLVIFGQLYYIPLYFLAVRGYTPIHTGIALLPVACTLVPGSIATGALVTRLNNFRWPIWVGWAVLTAGCGMTLLYDRGTSVAVWAVSLVVLGLGHGAILNAQNFASQAICDGGDEGAAAAMYGFMRHFGTALGVGIGGSTFQNVMSLKLRWENLPQAIADDAEGFIAQLHAMPDADPSKATIYDAYVFGFRGVFLVYLAASAAAFLLSLLIRHHDMNKEIETEQRLEDNRLSRMVDERFGNKSTEKFGNRSTVVSTPESVDSSDDGDLKSLKS